MRKITETLRLHFEHARTNREIALVIGTIVDPSVKTIMCRV